MRYLLILAALALAGCGGASDDAAESDVVEETIEAVEEVAGDAAETVEDAMDAASDKAEDAAEAVEEAAEGAMDEAESVEDALKEKAAEVEAAVEE